MTDKPIPPIPRANPETPEEIALKAAAAASALPNREITPTEAETIVKAAQKAREQTKSQQLQNLVARGKNQLREELRQPDPPAPRGRAAAAAAAAAPIPEDASSDAAKLCMKLNGYRSTYGGKITHRFQANYTPDMPLKSLEMEYNTVYLLVNSRDGLQLIEGLSDYLIEGIVRLHIHLEKGHLIQRHVDFKETYTKGKQEGLFEDVFAQLAIELAPWLSLGPGMRYVNIVGRLYMTCLNENMKTLSPAQRAMAEQAAAGFAQKYKL